MLLHSPRARRALSLFGLDPADPRAQPQPSLHHHARDLAADLARGSRIVLCIGPSGAGKSTALRHLLHALRQTPDLRVIDLPAIERRLRSSPRAPVDLLPGELDAALRDLARAGLGEAALFARPARHLSDGQRARLALALALRSAARHPGPALLLADEFLATLDRLTAACVARALRARLSAAPGPSALLATSHDDLLQPLAPDLLVRCALDAPPSLHRPQPHPDPLPIRIEPGCADDLRALARWHYRAARPAAVVRVLAARIDGVLVGALAISMPTLRARWRDLAWPGRYPAAHPRLAARRLNDELRRISRVLVDPRARGVGVATRLVRAYLASPLTPRTEAVAAMGRASDFFRAAGMTHHTLPAPARHARLHDALLHAAHLHPHRRAPFLDREARAWARAAAWTTRHAHPSAPIARILDLARDAGALQDPCDAAVHAYTHDAQPPPA